VKKFNHISNYLKARRAEVGISQGDLSRSIGFKNGQYISNIERGLCSIPSAKITALATSLKTKPRDIIDVMVMDYHDNVMRESGESV